MLGSLSRSQLVRGSYSMPDPLGLTDPEFVCQTLRCAREGAGFEERMVDHGLPALEGRGTVRGSAGL